MADEVVMEGAKWWFALLFMLVMMTAAGIWFHVTEVSPYKQAVNMVLEREGGYTVEAQENINEINKEYGDRFHFTPMKEIKDAAGNIKYIEAKSGDSDYHAVKKYGEKIFYRIDMRLSLLFVKALVGRDSVPIGINGYAYSRSREANI